MDKTFIIVLSAIITIAIAFLLFKVKGGNHAYKIRQSSKILNKFKSFEFDGARIYYLKKIDHFVFEELILSAFKKRGYFIKRNKRYTGDGGVDGIVYDSQNHEYLVQCKRYKSYVSKQDILDFQKLILERKSEG